ncbi:universal stress protein [Dehalobacterium formicoaceticum]|uniref:Universal stress protein n=1 Tax=Dehalobacterium formicoaceticum TaxID=51515 RepID=A0ABT1Y4L4_9FIRM|nr:universal stress protein [Dehalobacterium formicoaceticum]MCR6545817.1 universal stress protein [Dehalobacterium formicoaceticum]
MYQKILVATDGSEYSMRAADYALTIAEKSKAEVMIISVAQYLHEDVAYTELATAIKLKDSEKFIQRMREQAAKIVSQTARIFNERNIPVQAIVEVGNPADIICQKAEDLGIDLIVMGTRGNSGVTRFMLGSVSSKVVTHALCSVFVVR